jgi:hypothetical protein
MTKKKTFRIKSDASNDGTYRVQLEDLQHEALPIMDNVKKYLCEAPVILNKILAR